MRPGILFGVLALGAALAAQQGAPTRDPASLPAKDSHDGLLIAADPYLEDARYKERFGKKHPFQFGIVAIDTFFRNDNDRPIRLDLDAVRLILLPEGGRRQRLVAMTVEDVADVMLKKNTPNPTAPRPRFPPLGRVPSGGKGRAWESLVSDLRAQAFENEIIPAKTTIHGFFFFHAGENYDLVQTGHLYIPGLNFVGSDQGLLYFEVELGASKK